MKRLTLLLLLLCLLLSACVTPSAMDNAPAPTKPEAPVAQDAPADTASPSETPIPEEEPPEEIPTAPSCTITIRCDVLLDKLDELSLGVASLVPEDGCLLEETTVLLEEGDSAFDILQRVAQENQLHLEFSTSPMYDSTYVEGLCNLYEMDCGPLSGWTYRINDVFPGYGTSQYTISDGDVIQILYTCDLGADVGNNYSEATP